MGIFNELILRVYMETTFLSLKILKWSFYSASVYHYVNSISLIKRIIPFLLEALLLRGRDFARDKLWLVERGAERDRWLVVAFEDERWLVDFVETPLEE